MVRIVKRNKKIFLVFALLFSIAFFVMSFIKTNDVNALEIYYSFEQCDDNSGYSIAYPVKSSYHQDKHISHFSIVGATEEEGNIFRRSDEAITVYNIMDTDINNLFNTGNKINYDKWDGDVYSANFGGQEIGKGAIYIEVYYLDDYGNVKTETASYTNFLNDVKEGSKQELLTINQECDVRIFFVYEVTNALGTWYDNFRVNCYFSVRNQTNTVYAKTIGPAEEFKDEPPAQVAADSDIIEGSTVFNGFRLDYAGNKFYLTTVYRNNVIIGYYNYITIQNVYFTEEGVYEIVNQNAFGETRKFNLMVDRYKPKGTFNNIHYNYIFSSFTAFEWDMPQGYNYRSPVTLEISKDGGPYVPYKSKEIIDQAGFYSIQLKNEFYTVTYTIKIIDAVNPVYNYLNLKTLKPNNAATKYWGVDILADGETYTYCFAIDKYNDALEWSMQNEWLSVVSDGGKQIYRGQSYNSNEELTPALISFAEKNVNVKYTDIFKENNLILTAGLFSDEIPYLNNFTFTTESPIFSNKVYYIRQEDYLKITELDLQTAKNIGSIFEYGVSVDKQLDKTGTYLILDTNIYGHTYAFKAYYVNKSQTTAKIVYARNGNYKEIDVSASNNEMPPTVDSFTIKSIFDKYDPYAIVKVAFEGQNSESKTDYYIAGDTTELYNTAGEYTITFYDRNSNSFEFKVTVKNPLGNQIILEGAEPNATVSNTFKLYFSPNCQYLEIYENIFDQILYVCSSKVLVQAIEINYDNDKDLYYLTFERGESNKTYLIKFVNDEGEFMEFNIKLMAK